MNSDETPLGARQNDGMDEQPPESSSEYPVTTDTATCNSRPIHDT